MLRTGKMPVGAKRRLAFVGFATAGVETLYSNMVPAISARDDVDALLVRAQPYRPHGRLETMLPFLPTSTRGTLRTVLETAPLFTAEHLEAVWSQVDLPLLPWLLSANLTNRVRVAYSRDATPRQLRAFGGHYDYWGGRSPLKHRVRDRAMRLLLARTDVVVAWTEWAARSFRDDYGVPDARVRVLYPGVDTDRWRPAPDPATRTGLPRILFVGADFARKGGDLLLDVYREQLRGRVELDFVTSAGAVEPEPGIRVHANLRANDSALVALDQQADLFVLPTRADCFSVAGIEAMSCGVPVIITPVGGIPELLTSGREGLLIPADDGRALAESILMLTQSAERRNAMGRAARTLALARYDITTHVRDVLALLSEIAETHNERSPSRF
jgi:glycosyltransferase involved in cell wall biosynthesis